MEQCKHLTSLNLGEFTSDEDKDGTFLWNTFQKWSSLQLKHFSWKIYHENVRPETFQVICGWPLTSLDFGGGAVGFDVFGQHVFEMISQMRTLEKLTMPFMAENFDGTKEWDGAGMEHFKNLHSLTYLSWRCASLRHPNTMQHLLDIGKIIHLKELCMDFGEMDPEVDLENGFMNDLIQVLPPQLETLHIKGIYSWTRFPEQGIETLPCLTE